MTYDKTYAVRFVLSGAADEKVGKYAANWTADLRAITAYGQDAEVDPDERLVTLAWGMGGPHAGEALDAMEYVVCDPRVTDEEADAYYTYRQRVIERGDL